MYAMLLYMLIFYLIKAYLQCYFHIVSGEYNNSDATTNAIYGNVRLTN